MCYDKADYNQGWYIMFGYVVADRGSLTQEQEQRYRGCYCGLCHRIGRDFSSVQRVALNYDMTFLVLLLSSLYEPEEEYALRRCLAHPASRHAQWSTSVTAYAAAMNMSLAYYNCMDDWHDDHSPKALLQALLFRRASRQAAALYPQKDQAIRTCMERLSALERENAQEPDAAANVFALLMGELFVWKNDRWAPLLRQLGQSLGRFIYLMDAVLDLPEDKKRGRYNPLLSRLEEGCKQDDFLPVLRLMIGECTDAFERLPLVQDVELMRNILYTGVWARFSQTDRRKEDLHV